MGIFDKIGDVLGDVVDGVVDFVDDVIGIDLAKVLDNDIVKYGLMAASIFTGGVAIVNGVMQGAGTFAGTAGTFMNKFVAGAGSFVKGVASGFMAPGDTVGSILDGTAYSGAKAAATTGGELLTEAANQGTSAMDVLSPGTEEATAALESADELSLQALKEQTATGLTPQNEALSNQALDGVIPNPNQMDINAPDFDMAGAATRGPAGPAPIQVTGASSGAPGAAGGGDFLSKMGTAVKDFVTSPKGIQTGLGAIQGWAEGEQMKAIFEERRKLRERNAGAWGAAGQGYAPRTYSIPSLSELRNTVNTRGNAAQAKYGY
jgi:hypothetical protein